MRSETTYEQIIEIMKREYPTSLNLRAALMRLRKISTNSRPLSEIDEEKIEAFKGTVSLPFEKGDNAKIAVKIIDDRGIQSSRVISL